MKPEFDLCIIGGGSGGLVVAAGAAALGARVALVEKTALGGDCLYHGCVPSKTLLHSASVAHQVRNAQDFGIAAESPRVDIGQVMRRVHSVIKTIEVHDSPERFRDLGIEVIFGHGAFSDAQTFRVGARNLTAKHFVLATGSRAAIPKIEGLDDVPYLTNRSLFDLNEPVPQLIVIGGGPISAEMAQAFRRLGSEVDVLVQGERILEKDDRDLADVVAARLKVEGVRFHLKCKTKRVEREDSKLRVLVEDANGYEQWLEGTHLLIATGRSSNLEALGLQEAGVQIKDGKLVTDSHLRTTNPRVFACGDVAGPFQFTHMAEHQAGVVLRNALFHWPAKPEQRVVPWCTFTDPELARVGLSEDQARERGVTHQVNRFSFADIDRAQTTGSTSGFVKVISRPDGRLLGAAIVGPHAGELIHEYALALSRKMKLQQLSALIHIYPTLAQINRRVADERSKEQLTPFARKALGWLFGLRGPVGSAQKPPSEEPGVSRV